MGRHGNSAAKAVREGERDLEQAVSATVCDMSVLWLALEDEPGPDSLRGYIERNAIALLSNWKRQSVDPPSPGWLGHYSDREKVRQSGIWNSGDIRDVAEKA